MQELFKPEEGLDYSEFTARACRRRVDMMPPPVPTAVTQAKARWAAMFIAKPLGPDDDEASAAKPRPLVLADYYDAEGIAAVDRSVLAGDSMLVDASMLVEQSRAHSPGTAVTGTVGFRSSMEPSASSLPRRPLTRSGRRKPPQPLPKPLLAGPLGRSLNPSLRAAPSFRRKPTRKLKRSTRGGSTRAPAAAPAPAPEPAPGPGPLLAADNAVASSTATEWGYEVDEEGLYPLPQPGTPEWNAAVADIMRPEDVVHAHVETAEEKQTRLYTTHVLADMLASWMRLDNVRTRDAMKTMIRFL